MFRFVFKKMKKKTIDVQRRKKAIFSVMVSLENHKKGIHVEKRRTVIKAKDFLVIKDETKNKEQSPKKTKTTLLLNIH